MTHRRSSSSVTLVLIGASALSACGDQCPDTLRRDTYTSRADCALDWGADPAKCEAVTSGSGASSYTHYYGPSYASGSYGSSTQARNAGATSEARPGSHAMGTAHVSRNGFGASAESHGCAGGSGS